MPTVLPKMGAPLRVFSQEQVDNERALFVASPYNVSQRARALGIKPTSLRHHLRDLIAAQTIQGGKVPPAVQALITAGNALLPHLSGSPSALLARVAWASARNAVTLRKKTVAK